MLSAIPAQETVPLHSMPALELREVDELRELRELPDFAAIAPDRIRPLSADEYILKPRVQSSRSPERPRQALQIC